MDTSVSALPVTSPTSGQSPVTSPTPPAPPPIGNEQAQGRPNLFESEEFKRFQAAKDRELAQTRQELEREKQARMQLHQQHIENLPDDERPIAELELARQQLDETRSYIQQIETQRVEMEKQQALAQISQQYSVPPHLLTGAANWQEAEDLAKQWQQELSVTAERMAQERAAKIERNSGFLGGGQPVTTQTDIQERYAKAMRQRDAREVFRIQREAERSGVSLT